MDVENKPKPLTKFEVDLFMCRIQGALIEKDYDRIKKIQQEIKERLNEIRKGKEKWLK